jgi:hypothetical protein
MRASRSEDDDEDADVPVETDTGGASPTGHGSDLGELLLDLTVAIVKATILLAEADRDAWDELAPRLGFFRSALENFPSTPPPARRVGFVAPTPSNPPSRGRSPAKSRRSKRKA